MTEGGPTFEPTVPACRVGCKRTLPVTPSPKSTSPNQCALICIRFVSNSLYPKNVTLRTDSDHVMWLPTSLRARGLLT